MPSVTIDAGVLASPPERGSSEDIHSYVETLLDWRRLLKEPWIAIYMSERASEALFADGLFPLRDQLRLLFATNGIFEYDANTVAQFVDQLLQLTPSFETYFSIHDVLTEELSTHPDISQLCSGVRLQSDLARCIVLIAILRQQCREPIRDHSLILRRVPGRTIQVRALVSWLEHQRTDLKTIPVPPEYFEGDVLVCNDFRGLIDTLDQVAILLKATDDVGVETAIRIAVYKVRLERGIDLEWDDIPKYRIGHAFRTSLQKVHPTEQLAGKLIRAIVETIERSNMTAIHWLRTGPGGNDPQRVRGNDQAKAWRRDIDAEYHLHYWSCEDSTIEIASMGVHNDFGIPD